MESLELHPLKVYKFHANDSVLCLAQDLASLETYGKRLDENVHNYGSSTRNTHLYKNKKWKPIFSWISEALESVKKDQKLLCDNLGICLSWCNKSTYGEWHHPHIHPVSLISGIFYIKGRGGNTWFSIKNHYCSDFWDIHEDNKELIYIHKQTEGELLIFPSTLKHSVDINMSQDDRLTLSFNALPTGKVGSEAKLSFANLKII